MQSDVSTMLLGVLDEFDQGLSIQSAHVLFAKLRDGITESVKIVGVPGTTRLCDEYLRSEVKFQSLNSLFVSFMNRFPEELGEICESCLSLITSDTVACGASRGKRVEVEIAGSFRLDIELGEFCEEWTGCRVWPGVYHLSRLILDRSFSVEGKDVLELGSGVGVGAIACLLGGARRAVFTEYKQSLLDVSESNITRNVKPESQGKYSGFLLDWSSFDADSHNEFKAFRESCLEGQFTVIGSEIVYDEAHVDVVLNVLTELFRNGASQALIVIMLKPPRNGVDTFLDRIASMPHDSPFRSHVDLITSNGTEQLAACISLSSAS